MASKLRSQPLMALAVIVSAALILSACGRRGDPLKPSQAAIEAAKSEKRDVPEKPTANDANPDKRFILDGLLE